MLEKRLSGTILRAVSRVAGRKLEVQFKVQGLVTENRAENPQPETVVNPGLNVRIFDWENRLRKVVRTQAHI